MCSWYQRVLAGASCASHTPLAYIVVPSHPLATPPSVPRVTANTRWVGTLGGLWPPDTSVSPASPHAPLSYIPHATVTLGPARLSAAAHCSVCRVCPLPLYSCQVGGWVENQSLGHLIFRSLRDRLSVYSCLAKDEMYVLCVANKCECKQMNIDPMILFTDYYLILRAIYHIGLHIKCE